MVCSYTAEGLASKKGPCLFLQTVLSITVHTYALLSAPLQPHWLLGRILNYSQHPHKIPYAQSVYWLAVKHGPRIGDVIPPILYEASSYRTKISEENKKIQCPPHDIGTPAPFNLTEKEQEFLCKSWCSDIWMIWVLTTHRITWF